MIAPGMILIFMGYSLGSWGYCLVRGWDIPLRSWMSPVHPWTWPAGDVPTVPPGQVFPGQPGSQAAGPVSQSIGSTASSIPWDFIGAENVQAAGASQQAGQANSPGQNLGNIATQIGQAFRRLGQ